MIYGVKVRVVQEGTVFIEAETQDEAKKAAESADENMKNLLQYIYENQNGILEYREHMKKITHKVRIK